MPRKVNNFDFSATGNNGGDELHLRIVSQDRETALVHIKVAHCCVYSIDYIVPVEFLTALLVKAMSDIKTAVEELDWSQESKRKIADRISDIYDPRRDWLNE